MKHLYIIFFLLFFSVVSCEQQPMTKEKVVTESPTLRMMTYNIRLDVASDGENAWAKRKDFLSSQVQFYAPDIMGVQEARPNQMVDLKNALKNYKTVGTGRDGIDKGEYSAIKEN